MFLIMDCCSVEDSVTCGLVSFPDFFVLLSAMLSCRWKELFALPPKVLLRDWPSLLGNSVHGLK